MGDYWCGKGGEVFGWTWTELLASKSSYFMPEKRILLRHLNEESMEHIMVEKLSELTVLTEEEKKAVFDSFEQVLKPKGTHLLREGQMARAAYFVLRGCVRTYMLREDEEITTGFYTEGQSLQDFESLSTGKPSRFYFVCAEDCELLVLDAEKEKALYRAHPRFEIFCRQGTEQRMGERELDLAEMISLKPEARYRILMEKRPELIHRVPQHQIASFLGIKPETLSRIRQRLMQKSRT